MKVYGITEIARALDTDPGLVGKWRERHKLPAPDAELATGPVWLADTIEPLLAAGGPEPRTPGQRLRKFRVTARMTAGPYPALTNDRRSFFQAAIAAAPRTGDLEPPTVRWDMLDEAIVTMEFEAHDPSAAAEASRSIIRKNAELVAHIGVREIEIITISPSDLTGNGPAELLGVRVARRPVPGLASAAPLSDSTTVLGSCSPHTRPLDAHWARPGSAAASMKTAATRPLATFERNLMGLTRQQAREILGVYIRAWETQDPALICTIFTPAATYHERVLAEPIPDRDAIRAYWETKVAREQANITCELTEFYVDADRDTLIAEWEAWFDDLVKGERKHMKEIAVLTFEDGLVSSLREYWASERLGLRLLQLDRAIDTGPHSLAIGSELHAFPWTTLHLPIWDSMGNGRIECITATFDPSAGFAPGTPRLRDGGGRGSSCLPAAPRRRA